jgi:hypothetical protein
MILHNSLNMSLILNYFTLNLLFTLINLIINSLNLYFNSLIINISLLDTLHFKYILLSLFLFLFKYFIAIKTSFISNTVFNLLTTYLILFNLYIIVLINCNPNFLESIMCFITININHKVGEKIN